MSGSVEEQPGEEEGKDFNAARNEFESVGRKKKDNGEGEKEDVVYRQEVVEEEGKKEDVVYRQEVGSSEVAEGWRRKGKRFR